MALCTTRPPDPRATQRRPSGRRVCPFSRVWPRRYLERPERFRPALRSGRPAAAPGASGALFAPPGAQPSFYFFQAPVPPSPGAPPAAVGTAGGPFAPPDGIPEMPPFVQGLDWQSPAAPWSSSKGGPLWGPPQGGLLPSVPAPPAGAAANTFPPDSRKSGVALAPGLGTAAPQTPRDLDASGAGYYFLGGGNTQSHQPHPGRLYDVNMGAPRFPGSAPPAGSTR